MVQDWSEDQVTVYMDNYKELLSIFKRIVSVYKFKFLSEEHLKYYEVEHSELEKELSLNKDIVKTHKGNDLINCTKVAA